MKRIYEDFFIQLSDYSNELRKYVDSLHCNEKYTEEELNFMSNVENSLDI